MKIEEMSKEEIQYRCESAIGSNLERKYLSVSLEDDGNVRVLYCEPHVDDFNWICFEEIVINTKGRDEVKAYLIGEAPTFDAVEDCRAEIALRDAGEKVETLVREWVKARKDCRDIYPDDDYDEEDERYISRTDEEDCCLWMFEDV